MVRITETVMTLGGGASALGLVLVALAACADGSSGSASGNPGVTSGSSNGGSADGGSNPQTGGSAAGAPAGMANLGGNPSSNGGDAGGDSVSGASGGPGDGGASCLPCTDYGAPQSLGTIAEPTLDQLSGMAASHRNPGVLFVHNDRDLARFFAVSESGTLLRTFTIEGATVSDIEDIAVGPCPAGSCVTIADIGDNVTPRTEYVIVRVEEPSVDGAGASEITVTEFEQLTYSYPDGTHNGESLLLDPVTGGPYVITKLAAGMPSSAYRLPAFGEDGAAVKVNDLTVPMTADQPATAADAHPCGTGFLLRTNNTLYEFRISPGAAFEEAFFATPVVVPAAVEQQSEAVTYRPDGSGYYTTSEGTSPPINAVGCK